MMGIVSTKMFKGTIQEEMAIEDLTERKVYRKKRLINRLVIVFSMTAVCIVTEIILNAIGILVWDWNGVLGPNIWSMTNPILIYIFGYLHFWTISAIVYDCKKRWVQLLIVGSLFLIVVVSMVVFIPLGWI
jgi:peptidoglycan/LPS O-acetylase OafA/YrhL